MQIRYIDRNIIMHDTYAYTCIVIYIINIYIRFSIILGKRLQTKLIFIFIFIVIC